MGMLLGKGLIWVLVGLAAGWLQTASASNIVVTNAVLAPCIEAGQTFVQFDIKWDASWRASWEESGTWTNWDAAWIFVKYRTAGVADWAGLRPMTELEFEKACRGPLNPVASEYAWGSTAITDITGFSGTDGSGTETASPANANCNYGGTGILGPVRCGIFATAVSGRAAAGATYWGIMEMSGNVLERPVTVADAGRTFTGTVGDGKLDATTGDANAALWPGTSGSGAGVRAGGWADTATSRLCVSDRQYAALVSSDRYKDGGFRAVRQASSGAP